MSISAESAAFDPPAARQGKEIDLTGVIAAAPLTPHPFDHVYMEGVFSPAQYQAMMDNLPARESYHELRHPDAERPDGTSTRYRLFLYPENLKALPPSQRAVWSDVSRVLLSDQLQAAFKLKFKDALEARFGKSIDRLAFYPIPILVRDMPGYRIGIHSDSLTKAITVQFYLPSDASQKHIGTVFHEGLDGEARLRTTTMGFMPSSGYAFAVTKQKSWHSVDRTSDADGERNSLMLTYYVQNTPQKWLRWRRHRLMTYLGYPPSH